METIWKIISSIITQCIQQSVKFHNAIHGFCPNRGTHTAIIEAKLYQQRHITEGKPLYHIFLDISKAYDTIDRKQKIRVLQGYGVGENCIRILRTLWDNHTIMPRDGSLYGASFNAKRGVTQGDIISPIIFNIMIDATINAWD